MRRFGPEPRFFAAVPRGGRGSADYNERGVGKARAPAQTTEKSPVVRKAGWVPVPSVATFKAAAAAEPSAS